MSIKKWLVSLVASAFMVTAVFANDDDDKVFSLPFYPVLCPYPILKNLPKCDAFIKLNGHSYAVTSVAFSPDSQWLASGSRDDTFKWDPNTGKVSRRIEGHDDNTVRIWDPNTGELLRTLEGHTSWVYSVAFSPDSQLLASGSDDRTIKIWNPNTGDLLHTLKGHNYWIKSVAFSPDGQLLASGSSYGTIKIWNPNTGELLHTLEGHTRRVYSVAFSPDSQLLASGSSDDKIKIWNPKPESSCTHSKVIMTGLTQSLLVQMVNCLLLDHVIIRLKSGT